MFNRRLILTLFLIPLLFCGGCIMPKWNAKIPKGNKGQATQKETKKERIIGEISGDIILPENPPVDKDGKLLPPVKIRVDGVSAEFPAGTKGKLHIGANSSTSFDSFTEIFSSWKVNSAPVQLFLFGGIMVAVGGVMIFFGMARMGIACIIAGSTLIACGVMINSYPWVILIIVGMALLVGAYFIYNQYIKKKIDGQKGDQEYVLETLSDLIGRLPADVREEYIKAPLREDDNSAMVRDVTRRARGLPE